MSNVCDPIAGKNFLRTVADSARILHSTTPRQPGNIGIKLLNLTTKVHGVNIFSKGSFVKAAPLLKQIFITIKQ